MMCHLETLKTLRSDNTAVSELLSKSKKNQASADKLGKLEGFIEEIKQNEEK